jgi:hypothetical protein
MDVEGQEKEAKEVDSLPRLVEPMEIGWVPMAPIAQPSMNLLAQLGEAMGIAMALGLNPEPPLGMEEDD